MYGPFAVLEWKVAEPKPCAVCKGISFDFGKFHAWAPPARISLGEFAIRRVGQPRFD
jgi:hypothetical protein